MKNEKSSILKNALIWLIIIGITLSIPQILKVTLQTEYPLEVVVSGSMIPTLQVGDLIIVKGVTDGRDVYVGPDGDIIVFHRPGNPDELIAHRAVEKLLRGGTYYFRTKGDNNISIDGWIISEYDIVGKVVGRVPYVGYVLMFLSKPIGLVIAISVIAIIILHDLIPFIKEKIGGL